MLHLKFQFLVNVLLIFLLEKARLRVSTSLHTCPVKLLWNSLLALRRFAWRDKPFLCQSFVRQFWFLWQHFLLCASSCVQVSTPWWRQDLFYLVSGVGSPCRMNIALVMPFCLILSSMLSRQRSHVNEVNIIRKSALQWSHSYNSRDTWKERSAQHTVLLQTASTWKLNIMITDWFHLTALMPQPAQTWFALPTRNQDKTNLICFTDLELRQDERHRKERKK